MTTDSSRLSEGFQRLYCDASVFASFSTFHPISFAHVLPFQSQDLVVDDDRLIGAEEAHLADRNDLTRRKIIEAYAERGLLSVDEAANVTTAIDCFDADFFDLMGLIHANAGMFICALRWYREFIQELENQDPKASSRLDSDGVYPSVGYCLYSLGLFEEAISWTKSCIGPSLLADVICRSLIGYEVQLASGTILAVERSGPRTRYTVGAPADAGSEATARLKTAIKAIVPFEEIYLDWLSQDTPRAEFHSDGYPFRVERDAGDLPRHKMNLIFASYAHADALVERGYTTEARRLLFEAAMLEPGASFIWDRINALP